MGLTVAVDMEHFMPGTEIEVPGLGAFENGGDAREVTEAQEYAYVINNKTTVREGLGEEFTVEGTAAIGPTKADEILSAMEEQSEAIEDSLAVEVEPDDDKEGEGN